MVIFTLHMRYTLHSIDTIFYNNGLTWFGLNSLINFINQEFPAFSKSILNIEIGCTSVHLQHTES